MGMSSKVNVLGKEQNIERALSMHGLGAFRSLEFARNATSNIDMRWCATAADFRRGGLFDLLQFRIRLARGSWTNRCFLADRPKRSGLVSATTPLQLMRFWN